MPHSPRLNAGTLWVLDSGHGYLYRVDEKSGKAERVTFCPGFAVQSRDAHAHLRRGAIGSTAEVVAQ
jgi:hypothetical protein